jgi:curved DNA-binding protein CbpA
VAELARGSVADRPWGRTLGTLGLRGFTGQLSLVADGKRYQIAFIDGAVAGATSPLASDAAVRVALTGGLISSTQVAEIARRQAAAPERDEIELVSELLRIGPEQSMRLRRRTIAQRAARTFSVDRGEFVLDDQLTLAVVAGSEIDVRSVIYLGARQNLSEARLASDLAMIGAWFRLDPSAIDDLPQFGFTEADRPVLERLQVGVTFDELEAAGTETRIARAIIYALVSCNACEIAGAGRILEVAARQVTRPLRGPAESSPQLRAAGTIPPGASLGLAAASAAPATRLSSASGSGATRHPTPLPATGTSKHSAPPPAGGATLRRSPGTPSGGLAAASRSTVRRVPADPGRINEVRAVIAQRLLLLDQGADHFELLGVSPDAPPDDIRKAYFALARQLHPDRLAALGIDDSPRDAQRLFAQVNTAFAILSDEARRQEYASMLRRGGEAALRADLAQAEAMTRQIVESEEAFQRGEAALRGEQLAVAIAELARAVELNPGEGDYRAALAWAQFCAAPDKQLVGAQTREALEQAIAVSPNAIHARFLLGRVERILGRDVDALRHFRDVLRKAPHHQEAASEARLIEQRLAGPSRRR